MLKTITRAPLAALALAATVPAALAMNAVLTPFGLSPIAAAQAQGTDSAFLQSLGNRLTAIVNGSGSTAEKKAEVLPILNQDVDVEAIGRFCLGRFWRVATPAQQQQYLTLFHQVLVNSITGKLGDYRGVSIAVGQATPDNGDSLVSDRHQPAGPGAGQRAVEGERRQRLAEGGRHRGRGRQPEPDPTRAITPATSPTTATACRR